MSLKALVLTALGWAAGAKFAGQLINWAITLYVIRLLAPEDYGLMAMATVFLVIFVSISELGLGSALVQRQHIDTTVERKTFGFVLMVSFSLTLLLLLCAPFIAEQFNAPKLADVITVLSFTLIMLSFAIVPRAILLRKMDFKAQSLIDMSSNLVGGVVALLLASNGFGVWALVWSYLATHSVASIGLVIATKFYRLPDFNVKGMGDIISFGSWLTLERIAWVLWHQADNFIVGKLLGAKVLGFYSVAKHIAQLPNEKTLGIINQIAFPAYTKARIADDNPTYYLEKYIRISSIIGFPVFFGISCIAFPIIELLLGEKWLKVVVPLQILCLAMPLRMLEAGFAPYLHALGHVKTSLGNMLIGLILMITLMALGSLYGLLGASMAWAISSVSIFLVVLVRSARVTTVSVSRVLRIIGRVIMPSIVMYIGVISLSHLFDHDANVLIQIGLLITLGIAIYGVATWLLCRSEFIELLALFGIRKQRTMA